MVSIELNGPTRSTLLRSFFFTWLLPDWETLYRALAYGATPTVVAPYDTS